MFSSFIRPPEGLLSALIDATPESEITDLIRYEEEPHLICVFLKEMKTIYSERQLVVCEWCI